jgi:Fuc2NAc and GlcNAc transferase
MTLGYLLAAVAASSFGLTWALRRYALAHSLMDVPNERSSHHVATPRGGGMAIALTFVGCLPVLWAWDLLDLRMLAALSGSGSLVATIGFFDDHYHVSRRLRLCVHTIAAAWALFWLGGMPSLTVAGFDLPAWVTSGIAAIYIIWLINLYNFMDGIDGIASIEAVTVCAGGLFLYLTMMPGSPHWVVLAVLLASVAGFLYWNYPPARIFMGDTGSGFVGVTLAVFSIHAAQIVPNLFWAWVILLGVFTVDASITLIRRFSASGRKYLQPHRSHAYQYAARRLGAHKPVSVTVGAINLFWLFPLAAMVGLGHLSVVLGLLIAYLPLIALAFRLHAGAHEP